MNKTTKITATLKEIKYVTKLPDSLGTCDINDFINEILHIKSSFILTVDNEEYAISRWVSPKRTRSFPFARVYNTLCRKNRVTLIPFCKDEGGDGDRDFLQWDTVSLMSLFNVYVIVCYYHKAEKSTRTGQCHKNKITKQIFDYNYINDQLTELQNYHSSALHWNLEQMKCLHVVGKLTLGAYQKISDQTGVCLHSYSGIQERMNKITKSVSEFKGLSRALSMKAQTREIATNQPKEKTIGRKANITLTNLLGGMYYWTVDEHFVLDGRVFLVEKKHSGNKAIPSLNDIKDAFIKMALFSNICDLKLNCKRMPYYAAVGLTSNTINGVLHSEMNDGEIEYFFEKNNISSSGKNLVLSAVAEARCNGFGFFILNAKGAEDKQKNILMQLNR